jgi:hypothetical protein
VWPRPTNDRRSTRVGSIDVEVRLTPEWVILFDEDVPRFVTAEGKTVAVLTLTKDDVRELGGGEILHVRAITNP